MVKRCCLRRYTSDWKSRLVAAAKDGPGPVVQLRGRNALSARWASTTQAECAPEAQRREWPTCAANCGSRRQARAPLLLYTLLGPGVVYWFWSTLAIQFGEGTIFQWVSW